MIKNNPPLKMKVAIAHDYLNQYGGAERVLEVILEMYPKATVYTLLYDAKKTGYAFRNQRIKISFMQRIPGALNHHRYFFPLMPIAVESFDLRKFDLIISSSASYAKGVLAPPKSVHVNYCLTPLRYGWDDSHKYLAEFPFPWFFKKLAPLSLNYIRLWDLEASKRPDYMVAISKFVARRIKKYYGFDAPVVYPPVDLQSFVVSRQVDDYFLMVGRFTPYKRFDLAISVFNRLGLKLKIIGDGLDKKNLKKVARSNIEFLGKLNDAGLARYLRRCRALVFPQIEDFGIVPLEAMASGRPVLAYADGGALETVKEGVSGTFFYEQTIDSLEDGVKRIAKMEFDAEIIRRETMKFDKSEFKNQFSAVIETIMNKKYANRS